LTIERRKGGDMQEGNGIRFWLAVLVGRETDIPNYIEKPRQEEAMTTKHKKTIYGMLVCFLIMTMATMAHAQKTIKVGYIGPMKFIIGQECALTAEIAAEDINKAGGIKVGNTKYKVELVKVDSNEILSLPDAVSAMERLITVDKVDFIVGGYRTEAVLAMQEVIADKKAIWINCYTGSPEMVARVAKNYDRLKYYFKIATLNSKYIGDVVFNGLLIVRDQVKKELGIEKPRVAFLGEKALWVEPVLKAAQERIPQYGMELVGVWRPSITAQDVTAELSAIKQAGAHIIYFPACGPIGAVVPKQWGELQIPAAMIGFDCASMNDRNWASSGGLINYEATMAPFGEAKITPKTLPFIKKIKSRYGYTPSYCGVCYDAYQVLKGAIERAGTLDKDAVVAALEKTDYVGASGRIAFTQKGEQWVHDVVFGPGYTTTTIIQWINGKPMVIWPDGKPFLGDKKWVGVKYGGTAEYQLPPWMVKYWKSKK
jgi:branched-chain amino acid transport system substrate-binding protein